MIDVDIQQEIAKLQAELQHREKARADVIQDHIDAARARVPNGTAVQQPAFEEFLKAFERLYGELKTRGVLENDDKKTENN